MFFKSGQEFLNFLIFFILSQSWQFKNTPQYLQKLDIMVYFFLTLFIFRSYCTAFYQPVLHKSNIKFGCFCNLINWNSHLKK